MNILAVDTALGACSAAVLNDRSLLAHCHEPMERGHAERLAPMVCEAMAAARLEFSELQRLAVTVGPGTFTGQRVGYAFMRALRLALHRPLIGVTTLEAMAEAARHQAGTEFAAVLQDAKRGEVYVCAVNQGRTVVPVQLALLLDAIEMIRDAARTTGAILALAGTAVGPAQAHLRECGIDTVTTDIVAPDALWVGRMAVSAEEAETVPLPLYLRPPVARLPSPTP